MDARAALGVLTGAVGAALAFSAAATGSVAMAVAAGLCSAAAAVAAFRRTPAPGPAPTVPAPAVPPVEELDLASARDPVTGLAHPAFFRATLETRVVAARRHLRPVAVAVVEVVTGGPEAWAPADAALVARQIRRTLREADLAAAMAPGQVALLLEDTPESGAVWTVERLRRAVVEVLPGATMFAGVACYPAHAFDAPTLLDRASEALGAAREWNRDRIEVAVAEP